MFINEHVKQWLTENTDHAIGTWTDDDLWKTAAAKAMTDGTLDAETYKELCTMPATKTPTAGDLYGKRSTNPDIRVKAPSESYDETRYAAKSKRGESVMDPIYQQEVKSMSQASQARAGVLFKHLANKSGLVQHPMTEHEKALLTEMANEHDWCGKIGDEFYDKVTGHENVKALLDSSTSGGIEITPIEFDSDVVSFPLLNGELYPAVDIKPVPRGRRIEGASISTPTMAWGGGDGTSITPFTTTSMVAAIDTTIFTVDGAIEIGRDFLSDSAIDVGATLTALVGDRLMNELDKKIANGNGTTEIEGLFQKSGVATATPDNTTTGPPTLDDYYDLLFGVAKQYRKPAYNCAFVSNDTSFRRTRGIKIDVGTTDQRAALAPNMDASFFNTYSTLGWPHKIENNLANGYAGFFALKKYRLYRRLGMEMRFIDGGTTLAKANTILLVYRARYGGQLMDANAGIKWTNGQS